MDKLVSEFAPKVGRKARRSALREVRVHQAAAEGVAYKAQDPNYRILYYARYADDFILGLVGTKSDATRILQYITQYLYSYLKLDINVGKTKIAHHSKGALFLGYKIEGNYARDKVKLTSMQSGRDSQLKFKVPVEKLVTRYKERGFLMMAKKGLNKKRVVARRLDK